MQYQACFTDGDFARFTSYRMCRSSPFVDRLNLLPRGNDCLWHPVSQMDLDDEDDEKDSEKAPASVSDKMAS